MSDRLRRLIRNTGHNSAASLASVLAGLVVTPVLLASLGAERFGVWALLWAVTGSLTLVDMRLSSALVPFTAEALAKNDRATPSRLVATGFLFYFLLGIVELAAARGFSFHPRLLAWLPETLRGEAGAALLPAVGVLVLNSLSGVFLSFLQGAQRFDLTAGATMGTQLLRAVGLVLTARAGGGLLDLLKVELAVGAGQLALLGALSAPRLLLHSLRPEKSLLRRLFSFGGKLQVAHIAHVISLHADKMLLAAFLDLKSVAFYELGSKAALALRRIPLLLVSATTPLAAELNAEEKRARLKDFFVQGTRLLILTAAPLSIGAFFGADRLLLLWTGSAPPQAVLALRILTLGYLCNVASGMANSVALGMGKPEFEMRRSLGAGLLNPLASVILLSAIGFPGAPLGTAITLAVGALYLTGAVAKELNVPLSAVAGWGSRP